MADKLGFLDQLGIGTTDERALFQAQQQAAFRGRAGEQRALGRQASPLMHGLLGAAGGLITGDGGRSLGEAKRDFSRGMRDRDDQLVAQAAGIDVPTLRKRRALRKAISAADIPNDGSFESRIKLAEFAAKKAMELDAPEVLGQSLAMVTALRTQYEEFQKLQAQRKEAESDLVNDIWLEGEDRPRAAQIVPAGAWIADAQGKPQFVPIGQFSVTDPNENKDDILPFDRRYQLLVPSSERSLIANTIVAAKDGARKFRRVMSEIDDLSKLGGVQSVLGWSGPFVAGIDSIVRNAQGIVRPFLTTSKGRLERDDGTFVSLEDERKGFVRLASDPTHAIWDGIELPQAVQETAAAAQNYRAQIMDLAYAAARMAEPSNRGLSDNDIKNALDRITGGSANPQVIFRRFAEMAADSAIAIDDRIGVWAGHFSNSMTEDEFRLRVGGPTLQRYDREVAKLFDDFGISINEDGRAEFEEALDADVSPGEGIPELPGAHGGSAAGPKLDTVDDVINHVLGTPGTT